MVEKEKKQEINEEELSVSSERLTSTQKCNFYDASR